MKISFCMIVYNEAVTLSANMAHLYPHAHEIIVCEGAIALLRDQLGVNARSDDGTLDVLRDFPDPDRKLRVLQRNWLDKNQMSAAYAESATGDIIWHVDADEFYDPHTLQAVPREFDDDGVNALEIPMYVFWKSPAHVLVDADGVDRWFRYVRPVRRAPGMGVHHLPVRRIVDGRIDESGIRSPRNPNITGWHYAWNIDSRVRLKMRLYARREARTTRPHWVKDVWDQWAPESVRDDWPHGVHPSTLYELWPRRFDGNHPAAVQPLLENLTVGAEPVAVG